MHQLTACNIQKSQVITFRSEDRSPPFGTLAICLHVRYIYISCVPSKSDDVSLQQVDGKLTSSGLGKSGGPPLKTGSIWQPATGLCFYAINRTNYNLGNVGKVSVWIDIVYLSIRQVRPGVAPSYCATYFPKRDILHLSGSIGI